MSIAKDLSHELKHHAPFTAAGAVSGIILMVVLVVTAAPATLSSGFFHILHPLHVVLSALTTTALYRLHGGRKLWAVALIGYTGSIGIATLSDAIMPFWGGTLLGIDMHLHLPFIETHPFHLPFMHEHGAHHLAIPVWVVINAAAVIGIVLGGLFPTTKLPHFGHVLLSTWASLFGFTAFAMGDPNWLPRLPFVFIFLFLAVWIPCCASDIVYPLLWTKGHGRCTEEHPCHRHRE